MKTWVWELWEALIDQLADFDRCEDGNKAKAGNYEKKKRASAGPVKRSEEQSQWTSVEERKNGR